MNFAIERIYYPLPLCKETFERNRGGEVLPFPIAFDLRNFVRQATHRAGEFNDRRVWVDLDYSSLHRSTREQRIPFAEKTFCYQFADRPWSVGIGTKGPAFSSAVRTRDGIIGITPTVDGHVCDGNVDCDYFNRTVGQLACSDQQLGSVWCTAARPVGWIFIGATRNEMLIRRLRRHQMPTARVFRNQRNTAWLFGCPRGINAKDCSQR